jgi:sec-independent protein translocase protein TatA
MLQSPVDIAIVAGVILLIFGPKKVPELGKALGQGIGNFKRALFEAQDEVKTALKEDPSKPAAKSPTGETTASAGPSSGQEDAPAPKIIT